MADDKWYFTKEQLENSPSRRCGLDADTELNYRQQAANLIQDMGHRLFVSQLCLNTAIVYMHRFYVYHSFTHFHRNHIASASLFLAAKVEEQPRKLEHVINAACTCTKKPPHVDTNSEQFLEQAQDLVFNENVLLQTLGFDVAIDHPHTHVVNTCQLVRAHKDLAQTSYFMASNSLHMTTMCLQYKPTIVACFCIHLACKWSNWEIPQSNEGKCWFYYVDPTVTAKLLEQLTADFLHIFDRCSSRLKRKMMAINDQSPNMSNEQSIPNSPFDKEPRKLSANEAGVSMRSGLLPTPDNAKAQRHPPPSQPHSKSTNSISTQGLFLGSHESSQSSRHETVVGSSVQENAKLAGQESCLGTILDTQAYNQEPVQSSCQDNVGINQDCGLGTSQNAAQYNQHGHSGNLGLFTVPSGPVAHSLHGLHQPVRFNRMEPQYDKNIKHDPDKPLNTNKNHVKFDQKNINNGSRPKTLADKVTPVKSSHNSRSHGGRYSVPSNHSMNPPSMDLVANSMANQLCPNSGYYNYADNDSGMVGERLMNTTSKDSKMDTLRVHKSDHKGRPVQQKLNDGKCRDIKNGQKPVSNEFAKRDLSKSIPNIMEQKTISTSNKYQYNSSVQTKSSHISKSDMKLPVHQPLHILDDRTKGDAIHTPPKLIKSSSIFSPDKETSNSHSKKLKINKTPPLANKRHSPNHQKHDRKLESPKKSDRRPIEMTPVNQVVPPDLRTKPYNSAKKLTDTPATPSLNFIMPSAVSPFYSSVDPKKSSSASKSRNRTSSSSSEPELVPVVKKLDEISGFENIMKESKSGIKLNKVDMIQPLATNRSVSNTRSNFIFSDDATSDSKMSKILTNADLVSSLLKESLFDNKKTHGHFASSILPSTTINNNITSNFNQTSTSKDTQNLAQKANLPIGAPEGESESKHKSEKKKKKEKHKRKDRTKDERKKHKKDKEKHKERNEVISDTNTKAAGMSIKITIPKEKITVSPESSLNIKIPKERLKTESAPSQYTSGDSKPSLKIKFTKEQIENYSEPSKKRERDRSMPGDNGPAAKVSKSSKQEAKNDVYRTSNICKVSLEESVGTASSLDTRTRVPTRENRYREYGTDFTESRFNYQNNKYNNKYYNINNNDYKIHHNYYNNNVVLPQEIPDLNPYFYYPSSFPPPPLNQYMYSHNLLYKQSSSQFAYFAPPDVFSHDSRYNLALPEHSVGMGIATSGTDPPLPPGPPPEIPPPPPPPE